jgi:methionyl-tRNA synthetase
MSRFYITTAIPYANGAPHIGHAYERIATDAIQRFMRLDGRETLFVTGMDEYGLKVQQAAVREGVTPQAFVDSVAEKFDAMGDALNARADDVLRTTQPRHTRAVQELWRRMDANGDIYLSKYSGWYSVRDEAYFDESELTSAADGTKLAPTGAPAEWVEEESYFFRLSAYAEKLLAHYEANPDFVTPEAYRNEIVAFVKRGLADLSISRTAFNWGVPVPGDPKHVMYVWVDALTNYLTATGFPENGPRAKFWPADAHVIGKDITRFHAIYWPAFLMSAGLPVPRQIVVHGFLFNRGEKMSKSVGNVVSPEDLVRAYGVDPLRYFFLREVPFGQDGNYSHEAIVARLNADLANDIGNLAQRSLTMIARNCDGVVPDWREAAPKPEDLALLARADGLLAEARRHMQNFALSLYIGAVFDVVSEANRYFANAEPGRLAKSDPARMRLVLYLTI